MTVNTYMSTEEDIYEVLQQRLRSHEEKQAVLETKLSQMNRQLELKEQLIGNLEIDLEHAVNQLHKMNERNTEMM